MPNNRHKAIKRYTRRRCLRRLRTAARKMCLKTADPYLMAARVADFIIDRGLDLVPAPQPVLYIDDPGRASALSARLASAAARADDIIKHVAVVVADENDELSPAAFENIEKIRKAHNFKIDEITESAFKHLMATGKLPEIKFDNEEG